MFSSSRESRLVCDRRRHRVRVAVEALERRTLLTGDPDLSFNPRGDFGPFPGAVATDFGSIFDEAADVAIQPGGPLPGGGNGQERIVLAGTTRGGAGFLTGNDLALARYNLADGSLDTSFGLAGTVEVNLGLTIGGLEVVGGLLLPRFGFTSDTARAMAIQDNRRIVVAADVGFCAQFDADGCEYTTTMAVARFSADGALESSFSSRPGISAVLIGFGPSGEVIESEAHDVILQRVGGSQKILVAGGVDRAPDPERVRRDFAIARLNGDGTIDASFGTGGTMTVDLGGDDVAYGVAVQSDGKIVLVGTSRLGDPGSGRFRLALARLTANGSLDDAAPGAFDDDGKLATTLGFGTAHGVDVAIQTVGGEERIVVVGAVFGSLPLPDLLPPPSFNAVLARYQLDGTPIDVRETDLGTDNDEATSVVIDDQNRIVVAGSAGKSAAMLRFTRDGEPDPRFGIDGVAFGVRDALGSALFGANPRRIALQSNGQIVLTGRTPASGFGPPVDPPVRPPGVTGPAGRGSALPGGAVLPIGPRITIELPPDHDALVSRYHSQCAPLAEPTVVVVEPGVSEEIVLVGTDCESMDVDFAIGPTLPMHGTLTAPTPGAMTPGMPPDTPHTDTAVVTYTADATSTGLIDRFDFTVVDGRRIRSVPATVRIIIAPGDCTRVWDGEAGDRSWHTPANWIDDVLPGPTDFACIVDDVGAPPVTHTSGTTAIANLFSSVTIEITSSTLSLIDPAAPSIIDGDVVLTDGTLAANGTADIANDLLIQGGTLAGDGEVRVGGTVQMTRGAVMSGSGRTIIERTWEIGQAGGGDPLVKTVENRTVAVLGDARLISGVLRLTGRATVGNDGTFEFATGGTRIDTDSFDTAFINRGTILKSSDGNNDIQPRLDNPGTIDVRAGDLNIRSRFEQFDNITRTLTAGTYLVAESAALGLRFGSTLIEIKHNAATVELSGPGSRIITAGDPRDLTFATFSENSRSFAIRDGRSLETTPDDGEFLNSGTLTIGTPGSAPPPDANTFHVHGHFGQTGAGITRIHPDGQLIADDGIDFPPGSGVCGSDMTTPLVVVGGTIAPGCSPGIMTIHGDLMLTATGVLEVELGGPPRSPLADQLRVEGAITLAGSLDVRMIFEFQPLAGDRFEIVRNDGNDPIAGTFAGLPEGATVRVGPHRFRISYTGGDGNDVVLRYAGLVFAVFEPQQGILFVGGTNVADTMAVAPDPNAPNQNPAMGVFADGSPVPVIDVTGHPCKVASCPTVANTHQIAAQFADGDDRADVATLMGLGNKRLELLIHGGKGHDLLRGQIGAAAGAHVSNVPPAILGAVLVGDRGNDTIAFGYSGPLEVNLSLLVDGGAGNDQFDVAIAPQAGEPNGNPNPPPGDPAPPPNPVPDAFYSTNVLGAAGNDDVTANVSFPTDTCPASDSCPVVASIGFDLGAGNDRLALNLDSAAESLDLTLSVLAGTGNDDVTVLVSVTTSEFIVASIGIDLGAGNDMGTFQMARAGQSPNLPVPEVDVVLNIFAGRGNDQFGAALGLGQVQGSIAAKLSGESGNDSLALLIDAILDDQARLQALLDGGKGFDSCTTSKNITVQNCER